MTKTQFSEDRTVHDEVMRILDDLTDPLRSDDWATWEVRPLQDDDDFSHRPEFSEGDVPRYWWVAVEGRSMVADLNHSSASRVYFMADMAQDELAEERMEARPWCPVHRKNMMNIRLDGEEVFWECPDDKTVRCEVGGYWAWRNQLA